MSSPAVRTTATATPAEIQTGGAALERRIAALQRLLGAHAGGVELESISAGGTVRLRFTGMCAGCPFRPLTMHATLRPALLDLPGVTEVEADGARVSDEALERMRRYLGDWMIAPASGTIGGA